MNSGNFIIILTATFPALAISSFLFSLAIYFQAPEAHPETQDRVDNLEHLEDIVPAFIEEIRALRRMVDRERQRTRRLENEVRDMERRQRNREETADEAGDEAEMEDDGDGEVQKRQEGEIPVRKPFDINEFLIEQRAREQACRVIQRSRMNRNCGSNRDLTEDVPEFQAHGVRLRGGADIMLDDDKALEAAAVTELPPSPEGTSTPMNDENSTLTQTVRQHGREEICARMLGHEDTHAPAITRGSYTPLTNGFHQPSRPVVVHEYPRTPSPPRHQATFSFSRQPTVAHNPSPGSIPPFPQTHLSRQRLTRIATQNETEESRRANILTLILENTRPRITPRDITTIVEGYTRSQADADRNRAALTNWDVQEVPPREIHMRYTHSITTSTITGDTTTFRTVQSTIRTESRPTQNDPANNHTPAPSTDEHVPHPPLTNGHRESHTLLPTLTFTDFIPGPTGKFYISPRTADLVSPLRQTLQRVLPGLSRTVIDEILARYAVALGLGLANRAQNVMIRPSSAFVNGGVNRDGVEDLSVDADEDTFSGHEEVFERRLREIRADGGGVTAFHINGGIVMRDANNTTTHDEAAERLTAGPEDIRPRPRLSTPELNEAIGSWGSVTRTPSGLVLRLRGEGAAYEEIHHLQRAHADYGRDVARTSSESSTRSSRSASLSGTTLVNSAVGSTNGDTVPTSNPPTNGELSEGVELYRNGAYETPTATLRRRRDARDMRRAARENLLVERGSVEEESTGNSEESSEDSMDAEIAEVEEMWREIRRQRGTMEEEMMRHVAARERAVQAGQTNRVGMNGVGMNGVESEGGDEASEGSGSETRERRLDSE